MNQKIKTIFIGTPDFGIPALRSLIIDSNFDIVGVITQPDKKVGRKQLITQPPIKRLAIEYNIPVYQPEKIRNSSEISQVISGCDLVVVIAYAQIIPKSILELPKYGCVNIHGSLLPKYRGASCIQGAILNGDTETGITIMKMDEGLDTGPVIHQEKIIISSTDTAGDIFNKLSALGGEILPSILLRYISGELKAISQDNGKSSHVGMLKKEDGHINWNQSAEKIERFIRAMSPWPSAYSIINHQSRITNLKIISTKQLLLNINNHKPGTIFIKDNQLCVQCGDNSLVINQLQLEGKKISTAKEFLNGHQDFVGIILE